MAGNDELAEQFVRRCESEAGKQLSSDLVESLSSMLSSALEQGRREENEACAKLAEDRAQTYAELANKHDGTPLGSSYTDRLGATASIARYIRARAQKDPT